MNEVFDLAVIGSGVAGSAVAFKCKKRGLKVAIIEKDAFGGTCPNRGCDPKKILWGASQIAASAKNISHVFDGQIKLDWPQLIKFKKTFTDPVSGKRKKSLEQSGIEVIEGQAQFTGPHTIQVGSRMIKAKKIVIASGSKPRPMGLEGASHIITSDQFLEYESLPPSILFIGGGYISFEFAHIAVNSGVDITILHIDDRPLSMFDKDLVDRVLKISREAGINFIPNAPARAIKKQGNKIIVSTDNQSFECDLAIHGAGRVADIDSLNLEAANVEYGQGIKVNSYMQSISNDHIYAAGDCVESSPPLTPVASMEAGTVVENIIEGNRHAMDYSVIPSVVFTIPPLGSVGLGEEQAKKEGLEFDVAFKDASNWYNNRRLGIKHAAFKVLKEKQTGRLLGVHLLYPHAEDLMDIFSLILRNNLNTQQIKDTVLTYPSNTSDIKYMI